ncbi:MAG: hypothetical protein HUU20_25370 [Pirellulales bacterium]|nr:hypothetical protein [Pirellulales bacterium]
MTMVSILPMKTETGEVCYSAVAGDKRSQGNTAGEALDAITAQLPGDASGTLVIVQSRAPDRFFGVAQQQRLAELMRRWREARDRGETLSAEEHAELDALVQAELNASGSRAASIAEALDR